ncbi:MAG: DUF456 domain-containing protein [Candidatus Hydrogenedentes bacterium]|nr:DUF456 domain-containing protein [Candidatus Hydrogenedentota bacterium]
MLAALSAAGIGVLLGIVIIVALGLDLVGLFGNWIILGAMALVYFFSGFTMLGWVSLLIMLCLAIVGEVLETAFAGYGASKFGGSRGSIVAALVGCLVGAVAGTPLIPIPLVGTLVGACLGAFGGAALYEYIQMEKSHSEALWTGLGAALGKIGGLFAKLFCGLLMLLVAALGYYYGF